MNETQNRKIMKRLIVILFASSLTVYTSSAKSRDFETRTATVQVEVSPNDLINIEAKNTDLMVEAWDKNQVEIVATLRFDGKMTDKMTAFLENFQKHVEENIRKSGNELIIETNLDEPNKVQIGSKHVGIIIGFSEDEFRLDYKIKAPKANRFEIDHSYKDVSLIGDFRKMNLKQYSGDLTADFIQEAELNLKYGNAIIKGMGVVDMELYEQELEVETIDELEINTKYSEIEIDEIGTMKAVSYETDFVFGTIKSASGNYKYGEMEVKNRIGESDFEFYEMDLTANSAGSIEFTSSKYGKHEFGTISSLVMDQSYEDELTIDELGNFKSKDSKYGNHAIELLSGAFDLNAYEDDLEIEEVSSSVDRIAIAGKYINASFGISDQSYNLKTNVKYGTVDYDESAVEVKRYIKEGDKLEVEVLSKTASSNPIQVIVEGYEIDVEIN